MRQERPVEALVTLVTTLVWAAGSFTFFTYIANLFSTGPQRSVPRVWRSTCWCLVSPVSAAPPRSGMVDGCEGSIHGA